jgi:hypothetical protein
VAQDRVQLPDFVLAVFTFRVLLPQCLSVRETVCEDGRWTELAQDRVQWLDLLLAVLTLRVLYHSVCLLG